MGLALVEGREQGLPGEPAEDEHQAEEDEDGPEGQGRLDLQDVRVAARERPAPAVLVSPLSGPRTRSRRAGRLRGPSGRPAGGPSAREGQGPRAGIVCRAWGQPRDPRTRVSGAASRAGAGRAPARPVSAAGSTGGDDEAEHDEREERHALDQRGRDDHRRLDVAGELRLAGHALDGRRGQPPMPAGPDDDQADADPVEPGKGCGGRRSPGRTPWPMP